MGNDIDGHTVSYIENPLDRALLDTDTREAASLYVWRMQKGYLKTAIKENGKVKLWALHEFACGRMPGASGLDGLIVHHKNRNKLDNRKENLALLTREEHFLEHSKDKRVTKEDPRFRPRGKGRKGIQEVKAPVVATIEPKIEPKVFRYHDFCANCSPSKNRSP